MATNKERPTTTHNTETNRMISFSIASISTDDFIGGIESIDIQDGFSGWIIDCKSPQISVELLVYLNNELIGSTIPFIYRPDISELIGSPVVCGFHINWSSLSLPSTPLLVNNESNRTFSVVIRNNPHLFLPSLCKIPGDQNIVDSIFNSLPGTSSDSSQHTIMSMAGKNELHVTDPFVPTVAGIFDGVTHGYATGWVVDPTHPALPIQLELIVDNKPIDSCIVGGALEQDITPTHTNANRRFSIKLPEFVWDGLPHRINVRVTDNDKLLGENDTVIERKARYYGEIRKLNGPFLIGTAIDSVNRERSIDLTLFEDEEPISSGKTSTNGNFRLPIPNNLLDGRPHLFRLSAEDTNLTICWWAGLTPFSITPVDVLKKHLNDGIYPALDPIGGFRYSSLDAHISNLKATSITKTTQDIFDELGQLSNAHAVVRQGFYRDHPGKIYAPIVFPENDSPDVSIVIPVHNKFAVTYNCLASIRLSFNKASYEVIIVDDGSTDNTSNIDDIVTGIKVHRNEVSQGFVKSCNYGAEYALGRYVILLNNDTEVTYGWIDSLIEVFTNFTNVGLVGAKLLYPDGELQEAGGIVWNNGVVWNYGRNGNAHDPRYNYVRQTDFASGACIMLSRELWNEVGGFDLEFVPAYYEDSDLAFRIKDRGLKVMYTPFSQVIHFEGASNGTSLNSGIKRHQVINQPKFRKRWIRTYSKHGHEAQSPDLEKDRGCILRAVIFDGETPQPDRDAGSYSAIQEIRLLQEMGYKVTFVPANFAYFGHYTEELQRMGVECLHAPFFHSFEEVLEKRGREFDLVYIIRFYIAEMVDSHIRTHAPQAKIALNNSDLHFLRELRSAIDAKSSHKISDAVETRGRELAVMRKVDLVLSYNEVEHAVILSHNLESTKVAKCPWVVEVPDNIPNYEDRNGIVFLGGFAHSPNYRAIEFFLNEVMPLLNSKHPNIVLYVYGSQIPDKLYDLAETIPNVIVEGWVESVSTAYNKGRVFIAPLLDGAGIKGKVIGALAHGLPAVLSPIAAESTGVRDGLEVDIATKPQDWVSAISGLYNSKSKWNRYSRAARELTKTQYSFQTALKEMQMAFDVGSILYDGSNIEKSTPDY